LAELEYLPAFDLGTVGTAAHALGNYLAVTDGTVELLGLALKDHPEPDVHTWLQALRQATNLMLHTTGQMMSSAAASGPKLVLTRMDMVTGVQRACNYYQRVADRKQIHILF